MNAKLRNSIAEVISLLSLASTFVPQFKEAGVNLPPWLGILIALVVTVANQWVKDSTPPPTVAGKQNTGVGTPIILLGCLLGLSMGTTACQAPTSTNANVVVIENPNNQAKVVTGVISVAANRFLAKNPTYKAELVAVADSLVAAAHGNIRSFTQTDIAAILGKTSLNVAVQSEAANDAGLALDMFNTAFAIQFPGVKVNYGIFLDAVANGLYAATGHATVPVPVIPWPPVTPTPTPAS